MLLVSLTGDYKALLVIPLLCKLVGEIVASNADLIF